MDADPFDIRESRIIEDANDIVLTLQINRGVGDFLRSHELPVEQMGGAVSVNYEPVAVAPATLYSVYPELVIDLRS